MFKEIRLFVSPSHRGCLLSAYDYCRFFNKTCRSIGRLFTFDPGIFIEGLSVSVCMISHVLTNTNANECALFIFFCECLYRRYNLIYIKIFNVPSPLLHQYADVILTQLRLHLMLSLLIMISGKL